MSLVKRINFADEFVEVSHILTTFYKKLGINECVSFINSKDELAMVGCAATIITSIESDSVFFNVVKSKIKEYHEIYFCGSKSLICLISLLCEEAHMLINQDIPPNEIIDALLYSEDKIIGMLENFCIPLRKTSNKVANPIESFSNLKFYLTNYNKQVEELSKTNLSPMIKQICHTRNKSLLDALSKTITFLYRKEKSIQLWRDKVLVLRIQHYGCDNYFVEDSVWLPITHESSILVRKSSKLLHRVLIIEGDFNDAVNHFSVASNSDNSSIGQVKEFRDFMALPLSHYENADWWLQMLSTLTKYCVTCIIMTGNCHPKLKHVLETECFVIVIENILKNTLQYLLNAWGSESVAFYNQTSMNNILKDVSLSVAEESILTNKLFCQLKFEKIKKIVTVICAHSSWKMTAILEESFMHNLFRVQHSLNAEMVFPGEGYVENKVAGSLKVLSSKMLSTIEFVNNEENDSDMKVSNQCRSQNFAFSRPIVINSLASGLEKWAAILTKNLNETFGSNSEIEKKFDDPMTKVANWRYAINTLVTLLSLGNSLELPAEHSETVHSINRIL